MSIIQTMSTDRKKKEYIDKIGLIANRKEKKTKDEILFMFADVFNFYFFISIDSLFSVYAEWTTCDNEAIINVKFRIPHNDIICLTGLSEKEIDDIIAKINIQKEKLPYFSTPHGWKEVVNNDCTAVSVSFFRCKLCGFEDINGMQEYWHFSNEHEDIVDNVIHMKKKGPIRYLTKNNKCIICGMQFMFAEGGKYKDYDMILMHLLNAHSSGKEFDRLRKFVENKMLEW